jgi:hypothetical protein
MWLYSGKTTWVMWSKFTPAGAVLAFDVTQDQGQDISSCGILDSSQISVISSFWENLRLPNLRDMEQSNCPVLPVIRWIARL